MARIYTGYYIYCEWLVSVFWARLFFTVKLRLKKHWRTRQTTLKRFNTTFLRDTGILYEFKIALSSRILALQDLLKEEKTTVENIWKWIKEATAATLQEVLSCKKHDHEEWISIETLCMTQGRKGRQHLTTAE